MARSPLFEDLVGIVGAELAGLSCAYELKGSGVTASLYEATDRGGRDVLLVAWLLPGTGG